ncbi:unnamed protein product [Schistosoma margrebowiei]|uniref:Uncharacterized protein n=1 Tax=Schistosoma margrebowiei TaxID=48269 RepID=A0A183MW41_9TREM|nr:unnamed protein product [Schistosoma margrebowiei]
MPLLTTRATNYLVTWNTRTMWETGRGFQIAAEMRRHNLEVLGISETQQIDCLLPLEDVKTSTYLDSIIDQHGGSDADVKARIGKAKAAYQQLENIWNSKQLSPNTKVRIFNINVKTVLMYGVET